MKNSEDKIVIDLSKYAPIITDENISYNIYNEIMEKDPYNNIIVIDFKGIESISCRFAKIVFGRLFILLGYKKYYKNIFLINVKDTVNTVIMLGVRLIYEDKELISKNQDKVNIIKTNKIVLYCIYSMLILYIGLCIASGDLIDFSDKFINYRIGFVLLFFLYWMAIGIGSFITTLGSKL